MRYLMLLCVFCLMGQTAWAKTIQIYCPPKEAVQVIAQSGSWASYRYTATTPADIPALGYKLDMMAEGNAAKLNYLESATWVDKTLACIYNEGLDVVVLTSVSLEPYIKQCSFANQATDCTSSNPLACPMTCELRHK